MPTHKCNNSQPVNPNHSPDGKCPCGDDYRRRRRIDRAWTIASMMLAQAARFLLEHLF